MRNMTLDTGLNEIRDSDWLLDKCLDGILDIDWNILDDRYICPHSSRLFNVNTRFQVFLDYMVSNNSADS